MNRMVSSNSSLLTAFSTALPIRIRRLKSPRSLTMSASAPEKAPIGIARLKFNSTFTEDLPGDTRNDNKTRNVLNAAYSLVKPTHPSTDDLAPVWEQAVQEGSVARREGGDPTLKKSLIAWSPACASFFDLEGAYPDEVEEESIINVLGGFGSLWPGMSPYAMCYGGHQFGTWAGQLGDGRAISMGEYVNKAGDRWEIQLKGAGKTPYSRFADGRAVLRSSIREFLCSEAMYHLEVPTTRGLALVGTGAGVVRDMFYTGDPRLEPGAVVARVAPSFLRFGNFQLAAFRDDDTLLKETADYAIRYHFPHLMDMPEDSEDQEHGRYRAFVAEISRRTAELIAKWQAVGFVHGVMNTDNLSILGLTIDYGPYGFLDEYDPEYTPNTTDIPGRRYKYSSQPTVAQWNLMQLAKSMVKLCKKESMHKVVTEFEDFYHSAYDTIMSQKIGLSEVTSEANKNVLQEFLSNMRNSKADFTNTWRSLSQVSTTSNEADCKRWCERLSLNSDEQSTKAWMSWLEKYIGQLRSDQQNMSPEDRITTMNASNPVYILRNYLAQIAIDRAEKGDFSEVRQLYTLLTNPYQEQEGMEKYTSKPPQWASRPGVCVNSCSS